VAVDNSVSFGDGIDLRFEIRTRGKFLMKFVRHHSKRKGILVARKCKGTSLPGKKTSLISSKLRDASVWDKGIGYWLNSKHKKAMLMFNKYLRVYPRDAMAYCMRGESFAKLGDKQRALKDFNKAIKLAPKYASAFHSRGEFYLVMGDFSRAIQDFNKCLELYPDLSDFYNSRGKAFLKMGKLARAAKDFSRAMKLDPNNTELSGARACLYSSMIMYKKRNQRRAKQLFNRAIKLEPLLIWGDEVWQLAKDGFFPALEYLYKTVKAA